MIGVSDELGLAIVGPALAQARRELLAVPNHTSHALYMQGRLALRVCYRTRFGARLEVLAMASGQVQITVWRADGTPWPTAHLECQAYVGADAVDTRATELTWRLTVNPEQLGELSVTLAVRGEVLQAVTSPTATH